MSNEINGHLDRLKESFLCAAARGGRLEECASLLAMGAEVECSEGEEDTPLLAAIRNGHKDVAALLLAHGANPLQRDLEGNSVMHLAAANSDEGVASLLSPNAASLSLSTNDDGMTAIDVAVQRGFNAFAEHLHNLLYGAEEGKDDLPAALSIEEEDSANDESTVEDHEMTRTTLLDEDAGEYGREEDECSEEEELEVADTDDREDPDAVMNQLRHMTQLARSQSIELYQAKYALSEVMHERGEQEDETAALQNELAMGEDDVLAKMSLTELVALEEQVKCSLEKITKGEGTDLEQSGGRAGSVLLMNCRHLCVCAECGHLDILVQCPLCREPITERINVFA
ncbi:LOW QUALITY PROTEIN: hypothetical protein ACHAXT_002440 [Thalassiosira profunda]